MPLKRKVYTLDDMPDWLAEACSAIPIIDFDDPSIDDLSAEEYGRLCRSQIIEAPSPYAEEKSRSVLREIPSYKYWCRMQSHKVTWEAEPNGDFHSGPWTAEAADIRASFEAAKFLVENIGGAKGADIDTVGPMLFNEKAKDLCEAAGLKGLHFRKINAHYPDGTHADLSIYSAQVLSVTDCLDLERSSLSWKRQRDGSGFTCSGGSGRREHFKSSELSGISFFWDISISGEVFVSRAFLDVLADNRLVSNIEAV
ncbi:MAG: hypothetical protein QUV02_03550 [Maricaulis sp.]|uniref:imm11 family protein n=1 Tax=Maricaulis sp. TaxID=1486257 RepID=UPI00260D54CA|nr:DUF1629 domain-containing protein [Maricaulis sp.]MDM7983496.1 hypothetical protein [Maricaulis sp.]